MSHRYVSFRLGGELWGLDILQVRETMETPTFVSVPRAQSHIAGLMNLRGQVVCVMDLRARVYGKRAKNAQNVLILKGFNELPDPAMCEGAENLENVGDETIGILVDSVSDVVAIEEDDIELAANATDNSDVETRFVRGVAQVNEELMMLVSLNELVNVAA
ncbi:MAG: purine-binding chemotaxis protein CheW [Deltaproteobacteria bacterium]|nr:purine-binding chemotaxis protein CheW [Deltaproteobacteria bacterium]